MDTMRTMDINKQNIENKLSVAHKNCNINQAIQLALHNFKDLAIKPEFMKRLEKYIKQYSSILTHKSIKTLETFINGDFANYAKHYNMDVALSRLQSKSSGKKLEVGCALFPAVATEGSIYQIKIIQNKNKNKNSIIKHLTKEHLHLLDMVGASLFEFLNTKTKRCILWSPSDYSFTICNAFGIEDDNIEGSSLSISLMMALFSNITGKVVPLNIIATGSVDRHGKIEQVASLAEKLEVIKNERDYIKTVIIAENQELPEKHPEFNFERVKTIEDVIKLIFHDKNDGSFYDKIDKLKVTVDVNQEIQNLKQQYDNYLIDTCIQNAKSLIPYIEKKIKNKKLKVQGTNKNQEYLFECYWKLGACYCHQGNVEKSEQYLKKARKLYKQSKGAIDRRVYLESRNNYAVLLKDIFCYKKAEKLHKEICQDMQDRKVGNSEIGKNFSSMSQLYMAQKNFEKAEKFQLMALEKIDSNENHRNYGYLAQIYTRDEKFKKAKKNLENAKNHIDSLSVDDKQRSLPFFHWFESEYLYSKIKSLERRSNQYLQQLQNIASIYQDIRSYVPGLINKFCGLGIMLYNGGNVNKGLELLSKTQEFFDNQSNPVLKLLGVTVKIETLIAKSIRQENEQDKGNLICELEKIINDLSVEKNIEKYFKQDIKKIKKLSNLLKKKSIISKDINNNLTVILQRINEKIPY